MCKDIPIKVGIWFFIFSSWSFLLMVQIQLSPQRRMLECIEKWYILWFRQPCKGIVRHKASQKDLLIMVKIYTHWTPKIIKSSILFNLSRSLYRLHGLWNFQEKVASNLVWNVLPTNIKAESQMHRPQYKNVRKP